jgi:hypothetical protein
MAPVEFSPADRIKTLLEQLRLARVHVGACMSGDWGEFVTQHADCIHSLTVVAPHLNTGVPEALKTFRSPVMVLTGDQGAPAQRAHDLAGRFENGVLIELRNYASPMWADTVADRTADVAEAVCEFLAGVDREHPLSPTALSEGDGEFAGIR